MTSCRSRMSEMDFSKLLDPVLDQVMDMRDNMNEALKEVCLMNSEDPPQMESITIVMKRGKNGYGFSVTGSSPATVRRVEEGSTAWQAGLRIGDSVIRINGQNVSRSIADSVAKIVRQSERQIVLDVEHDNPDLFSKCSDITCLKIKHESKLAKRLPLATISEDSNKIPAANTIICKADIEPQPSTSSDESSMDLSTDSSQDRMIDLGDWELPQSSKHSFPSIRISFDDLSEQEQDRQLTIRALLKCEQDFVADMQFGIQRYSNPLRHKFVSPAEHVTLFQGVERLVAICEYHVHKLREESVAYSDVKDSNTTFMDIVGCIYLPKLLMMAETFEHYCNGIKNSFRLLAELKDFEEFDHFLQDSPLESGQLSISGFIQRPLEHIKNIVLNLQKVLSLTPLDHQDMDNLSQVIETLRNTCNRINESNTRRCGSMMSLVSRSSSRSSRRSSSKVTSSSENLTTFTVLSDSSSGSIESCIDAEVLDIQRRLVFCEHVQAFQLATATRHMIYGGELLHVDGPLCTKLYAFLMNDLLLLTKVQENRSLLVVDFPILLHDVVEMDWRDSETMDFVLGVESTTHSAWVEPRDVTLRAPSHEHKYTWRNILEQRIESSKIQQQLSSMDNFV